jgi:MFS_1 like family
MGVAMAMFFSYAGIAANQFHGYLFEIKGHGALAIGWLFMTGYGVGIGAPFIQVLLIRKWHGPYWPLALVALGGALSMAYLPWASGFWALWGAFSVLSFCLASLFPLLNAATLETTRGKGHSHFIRIRGFGSLGFLFASVLCLAVPRSERLPHLYLGFALGLLLALFFIAPAGLFHRSQRLQRAAPVIRAPNIRKAMRRLFRGEAVILVLLLATMSYANVMATAMQGNYIIHQFGLDQRSISLAWTISTLCELVWMALCAYVVQTMDLRRMMVLGLWGTLAKLLLLAVATNYFTYVLGLAFHGLFFSFSLTGFGVYLDRRFRASERPGQQALTSGLVQGIPAALAGISSGWIWNSLELKSVYITAAILAGAICLVGEFWVRRRIGNFSGTRRVHS